MNTNFQLVTVETPEAVFQALVIIQKGEVVESFIWSLN